MDQSASNYLSQLRAGLNPSENTPAVFGVVQGNPVNCNGSGPIPPTPQSFAIQPSLSQGCGTARICIGNAAAAPVFLNLGLMGDLAAGCMQRWGTRLNQFAPFATETATALDCSANVAVNAPNVPTLQLWNAVTRTEKIIIGGIRVKILGVVSGEGANNIELQKVNSLNLVGANIGRNFSITDQEIIPNDCSVCFNSTTDNPVITFEDGNTPIHINDKFGLFYRIEANTRLNFEFCILGVDSIGNYVPCSTPSFVS